MPWVRLRKTKAGSVEGDTGDRKLGGAGLVERQVEGIAVQEVDAVEGRILRGGVDLLQHVVVLRDQAGAGGLRVRIGDRSRTTGAQAGERSTVVVTAVPLIAPTVFEAALLVVVMLISPVESMLA